MSKIFVDVAMSLDGFIAGDNRGPSNPLGDNGLALHKWMFMQEAFLKHIKQPGGQTNNPDNDLIQRIFDRIGVSILGKRMFEEGEANWPEEAPFHSPVLVLTHHAREPWERIGTTFYFETRGIHHALDRARQLAGGKDIRISGGAETIQQYLNAGLVEELNIHLAPILLGSGVKLFDNVDAGSVSFELVETIQSPLVTHLKYHVLNK